MGVTPINSLADFQKIINSGKVVAIDFWAAWCGPCRMISPVFESLSSEVDNVEFYKVDVDAQRDISRKVGIKAMPTFLVFKDGQKVNELVGANSSALKNLINTSVSLA